MEQDGVRSYRVRWDGVEWGVIGKDRMRWDDMRWGKMGLDEIFLVIFSSHLCANCLFSGEPYLFLLIALEVRPSVDYRER